MIPLVRRWAIDWLASHDPSACDTVFAPDYRLRIGSVSLEGRDAYREGTLGQLANYPGLLITVHEVIASGDLAAVHFTEHGAAAHRGGALAAWTGIVLHRGRDGVLVESWAEEDYAARQRQLVSGEPDDILPPAIAPWDSEELPADPDAEAAVREWLAAGPAPSDSILFDDGDLQKAAAPLPPLEFDVLFSAGPRVAFHGRAEHPDGVVQGVSGLVRVDDGRVVSGRLVTDRAGAASARRRMVVG